MFRISISTAPDVICHLLSSQTSLVQPRLLSRVDFSEATVLSVYLEIKSLEPGQTLENYSSLAKSFHSPLPGKVPLLLATVRDGIAIRLVLHVDIHPGRRGIHHCHWIVACINSRVLLFFVRLNHSHPVVVLLLCIHLAVCTSHGAGPSHLGITDPRFNTHSVRA